MTEIILKYCNPQVIILIGAGISIYGSYLASFKADKESKENDKKIELIQTLSKETNKQVTGGNSYVLFDVSFVDNTDIINFNTENLGDVKLENVTVIISDMERISSINPYKQDIYKESKKYITERFYPVLYPKSPIEDLDFGVDDKFDNIRLDVDIRFGNRHILQYISIRKYKNPEVRQGEVKVVENNKIIQHYTFGKSQEPTYIVK
jgi:hypothetical protein